MGKYDALFEDEDDIFQGTPESKYWDIYNQVSDDLAEQYIDKLLTRMAAMERILMETINEEELDRHIQQYTFENSMEVEAHKKSLYMELAGQLIYSMSD